MESPDRPIDSSAAREALADVDRASAALGIHMKTPWWYHVGLAAALGAICVSFALPPGARIVIVLLSALLLVGLMRALVAINGAWVSGVSRAGGTRAIAVGVGIVAVIGVIGSMLARDAGESWLAYVIGAVVFVIAAAGGWAWDAAYRRSLEASA